MRRKDVEKENVELKGSLKRATEHNYEVMMMDQRIEKLKGDVKGDHRTQIQNVSILKLHMAQLYKELGKTDFQAWYHTLVEAGEYNALGPIVSAMLAEGQARNGVQPQQLEKAAMANESDAQEIDEGLNAEQEPCSQEDDAQI